MRLRRSVVWGSRLGVSPRGGPDTPHVCRPLLAIGGALLRGDTLRGEPRASLRQGASALLVDLPHVPFASRAAPRVTAQKLSDTPNPIRPRLTTGATRRLDTGVLFQPSLRMPHPTSAPTIAPPAPPTTPPRTAAPVLSDSLAVPNMSLKAAKTTPPARAPSPHPTKAPAFAWPCLPWEMSTRATFASGTGVRAEAESFLDCSTTVSCCTRTSVPYSTRCGSPFNLTRRTVPGGMTWLARLVVIAAQSARVATRSGNRMTRTRRIAGS